MGLTTLLHHLRTVILQDSVIFQAEYPTHPVWNHPVFSHPDYKLFAEELHTAIKEIESLSQLEILYQALPILKDYL